MLALITGASSGLGAEFAGYLYSLGYDLVLTARSEDRLQALARELGARTENTDESQSAPGESLECTGTVEGRSSHLSHFIRIFPADLSRREECFRLHDQLNEELAQSGMHVDFLVNNAGLGVYGRFIETDLERELGLIDVNITALHILTKLYLRDMTAHGGGVILNVGSSAGFMAGPTFSSYYASKNYVVRLTEAIHEELRRVKSPVKISVLCPGPVKTPFNQNAGVRIPAEGMDPARAARLGVDGALRGKMVIVPGFFMKLGLFFMHHMSENLMTRITYLIQVRKEGDN